MRSLTIALTAAAFCLAVCPGAAVSDAAEGESAPVQIVGDLEPRPELERISGIRGWLVNGEEVSVEEVRNRAFLYHGPYIVQDIVAALLLEQEARRRNMTLTEEEVQAKMKALREELGVRSQAALESFLQSERVTEEWFRSKARDYALMEKVLADRVYVSDREVESFYQSNRQAYRRPETAAYRVIAYTSEAAADAAVQQLRQGRAFKDVEQEAARTPAERAVAGELQLYERGQQRRLPPELDAVIFASPLNQVLGPIAVQNVYYLFRVEKRMDPHQFTLEEVRPIIREQLRRQKLEQVEWPRWIRSQLANADIQVLEVESPQVGDESADPGLAQPAD